MFVLFKSQPDIVATLSRRSDGNMLLIDENQAGLDNRQRFLSNYQLQPSDLTRAGLAHGNEVRVVGPKDKGQIIDDVDGLISADKGMALSITVADCLPVYFYDPIHRVIGLAHAGWRGVAQNIISQMIAKMIQQYATDPTQLLVGVGPGIGDCHFEVKDNVAQALSEYGEHIFRTTDGTIFINLKSIARKQLSDCGVVADNLEISPECTYDEKEKYFSRRRDQPVKEAMIAVMVLR